MSTFVVLRNMSILSKQEMFKINRTFDRENFQACARAHAHAIFNIINFRPENINSCEIYVLRTKIKYFSSLFT